MTHAMIGAKGAKGGGWRVRRLGGRLRGFGWRTPVLVAAEVTWPRERDERDYHPVGRTMVTVGQPLRFYRTFALGCFTVGPKGRSRMTVSAGDDMAAERCIPEDAGLRPV